MDEADNHLQACFLLHGNAGKRAKKPKARPQQLEVLLPPCILDEPSECRKWRLQAFEFVWSCIERLAMDTLEKLNLDSFKELEQWINNSEYCKAQMDLYSSPGVFAKQLSTALLFSGAVDSSDCLLNSLAAFLKEGRCCVAQLQPHDFLHGVSGPLRSLFKQFIDFTPETTDMEILAAWHRDKTFPLVVIVEDTERCNSSILSELLVILSEWTSEIPFILVLGMATTQDSLRTLLPASVMGRLQIRSFVLKPPVDRLEAVIRKSLLDLLHPFFLEHSVIKLAYDYFFTHDNSVSSFLRILKISCMEHFCRQPLSFLCEKIARLTTQDEFEKLYSKLPPTLLAYATKLPSASSATVPLAESLWNWKTCKQLWSMGLQCFLAAGSRSGFSFHDVFSGALNTNDGKNILAQIIDKTRSLSIATLLEILEDWKLVACQHDASYKLLRTLQQQLEDAKLHPAKPPSNTSPCKTLPCSPSKMTRRMRALIGADSPPPKKTTEKAVAASTTWKCTTVDFLDQMRRYVTAISNMPFREIFCFKDTILLKEALTGDTRKNVHLDLTFSQTKLRCECCSADGSLSSSVHDTSLSYAISQEHSELVNVHDWYQSFETILRGAPASEQSSKRKKISHASTERAAAQARFSWAVAELHVIGLLRLPKNRNPDFVQRVNLGYEQL